jgi:hypothetical protein
MSTVKDYRLELTDYEQVYLEKRDKERDKQIATNMLKEGSKVEFISKVTGLTISEVEELNKNFE